MVRSRDTAALQISAKHPRIQRFQSCEYLFSFFFDFYFFGATSSGAFLALLLMAMVLGIGSRSSRQILYPLSYLSIPKAEHISKKGYGLSDYNKSLSWWFKANINSFLEANWSGKMQNVGSLLIWLENQLVLSLLGLIFGTSNTKKCFLWFNYIKYYTLAYILKYLKKILGQPDVVQCRDLRLCVSWALWC